MLRLFQKNTPSPGPVEFMIVGLGNPGKQYENTRHNAGFLAVDTIAQKHHTDIKRIKFKGLVGECSLGGKKALLLKPSTFMNLSGQSVREAMQFYKLPPEKVLVIFDDINLEPGKLRIRRKGSDGGHNGMKNIIYLSGSDQFPASSWGWAKSPIPTTTWRIGCSPALRRRSRRTWPPPWRTPRPPRSSSPKVTWTGP